MTSSHESSDGEDENTKRDESNPESNPLQVEQEKNPKQSKSNENENKSTPKKAQPNRPKEMSDNQTEKKKKNVSKRPDDEKKDDEDNEQNENNGVDDSAKTNDNEKGKNEQSAPGNKKFNLKAFSRSRLSDYFKNKNTDGKKQNVATKSKSTSVTKRSGGSQKVLSNKGILI